MKEISRREFLGRKPSSEATSEEENLAKGSVENTTTQEKTLSRRQFLGLLAALGAVAGSQGLTANEANAQGAILNRRTDLKSYKETIIENAFSYAAQVIASAILSQLGIAQGNRSFDEKALMEALRNKPIDTFIKGSVVAPLLEEAVFRALPAGFVSANDTRMRWDIGIPSTVLFALIHNHKASTPDSPTTFAKDSVPLSQFIAGLFFWYLMRERGFNHAVLAHSMQNTIAFTIAKLMLEKYPGNNDEQ